MTSLFNWNTKQVFVYIVASYPSSSPSTIPSSELVIWDAIIPADNAPLHPNTYIHPTPKNSKTKTKTKTKTTAAAMMCKKTSRWKTNKVLRQYAQNGGWDLRSSVERKRHYGSEGQKV